MFSISRLREQETRKMNIKKEAWKALAGIVYVIVFINLIRYFELTFWWIYLIMVCTSSIWSMIRKSFNLKSLIKTSVTILIIMYIFKFLQPMGTFGYVLGIILICGLILYTKRKNYFKTKHYIESMLWGKPLYKFREEGKKPPKIGVEW